MTEFDIAFQRLIERQAAGEVKCLGLGDSVDQRIIYYEEPHDKWTGENRVEFDTAGLLTGHYMYVRRG